MRADGERRRGAGGGAGVAAAGQRHAAQPAIDVPPSLKLTVPVGAEPVTVAVKVTLAPTIDGVSDVATVVDVATAAGLTTCDSAALVDARLPASPA